MTPAEEFTQSVSAYQRSLLRLVHQAPQVRYTYADLKQIIRRYRPSELLIELAKLATLVQPEALPVAVSAAADLWSAAPPWAIAAIARDSLIYGNEHRTRAVDVDALRLIFNHWSHADDADDDYDRLAGTIMTRHAYEQFPYQESLIEEIARTQALLVDGLPLAASRVIDEGTLTELLGAPIGQVVGATFFLQIAATRAAGLFDPTLLTRPDFAPIFKSWPAEVIRRRQLDLTLDVAAFKADFARVRSPHRGHRWEYNPLHGHPFVKLPDGRSLAPQPTLILRTITPGALYYPGVARYGSGFAEDLGRLTESYVGRQLRLLADAEVYPEITYSKKDNAKTIDWFLVLKKTVVLIEVKSLRPTIDQRASLATAPDTAVERLDHALGQISVTDALLREDHPKLRSIPRDRQRIGIVVTAEPFYLANAPFMREKMSSSNIPTLVASLREIEDIVCLPADELEERLLAIVQDPERSTWRLSSSLNSNRTEFNPILKAARDRFPWPKASLRPR